MTEYSSSGDRLNRIRNALSAVVTESEIKIRPLKLRYVGAGTPLSGYARKIREARDALKKRFPERLISDPALDMLLELFIAHEERGHLTISFLATAGGTPMTSGLRWISKLEILGLLTRLSDPFDRRRGYLVLSGRGRELMSKWLTDWIDV